MRTVVLDEDMGQTAAALLDRLPPTAPLAWVRGDSGLVGWGAAATVELSGPDHFAAAQAWWTAWLAGVRLPVADGEGRLVGAIALTDLVRPRS